jgi:hypothetical protein
VGAASEPQRSASGYHVLVLLDRAPGFAPKLADVQDEVRAELRRRESERALRAYLDDLRAQADVRVRQGREAASAPQVSRSEPQASEGDRAREAERSVGPREGLEP